MAYVEEIEHTADLALRVRGSDLEDLLLGAACRLGEILAPADKPQGIMEKVEIDISAYDCESLLVEWLNELVFRAETEGIVFRDFQTGQVDCSHLKVTAWGERVAGLHTYIKAVTYHQLEIIRTDAGLEVTIVFDL